MNLRTSFVLSLVFAVWVATCVYAYVTHEKRPCLTKYPGTGTGDCAQTTCHALDPDYPNGYYVRSIGIEYHMCGTTEYYLNCEEQGPSTPDCAVWYRYANEDDCRNQRNGGVYFEAKSNTPSCKEYSWQ